MPNRRLVLRRESLGRLESDELASVAGAITGLHPTCIVTSYQYSQCYSCGIACTQFCLTNNCPTDTCH